MYNHLYQKRKPCPALHLDIDLTDEVKQYIMNNRVFKAEQKDPQIKKLQVEIAILKDKKDESVYQLLLQNFLGGKHLQLNIGVTDISTDRLHAEIKLWNCWKEAIGQLLVYNKEAPRETLYLYLFGKYSKKCKVKAVEMIQSFGIKPFEVEVVKDEFRITDLVTSEIIYTQDMKSLTS